MIRFLLIISLFITAVRLNAEAIKEFSHPAIYSFEESIFPAEGDKNSTLALSREHYKHLQSSLKWQWNAPLAQWSIRRPIPYEPENSTAGDNSVSTFVFWVYAEQPIDDGKLKIEFLKEGRVCCFFEYGTGFRGWRGAWAAFDRDMQGRPETGMDEMRITAPAVSDGTLYFDHIILSSFQDVRHHTADFQAPYINAATQSHWLILQSSWQHDFDIQLPEKVSESEAESIAEIEQRLARLLLEGRKTAAYETLSKRFSRYRIKLNAGGTYQGLPVFFERYGETYHYLGADKYNIIYNNPMGISQAASLLMDLAAACHKTTDVNKKSDYEKMYIMLMNHLLDQGFQAGSSMGTLHHLGYSMRLYYTSAFLMRGVLEKAGLKHEVQQSMEWFSGAREIKRKPAAPGMDIDAFNTSLIPRLCGILMLENSPEKTAYLYSFKRWMDNGLLHADGTSGSFKIDGSIFHHRHNYPAYAVGGLEGAVNAVCLLNKTDFQLSRESRENLKKALLAMRTYCNLLTWPLSLSGRHPDGKGHLIPEHYAKLALCGSPDGSQAVDKELAAAYLRLVQNKPGRYTNRFLQQDITAEPAPSGNWSFTYSCLSVHRRDGWCAAAMGHSRYLWAAESYIGANLYGRYLNHGSLQLLTGGNPVSNTGSGFMQEGWDWNHFPGTTAAVLPMNELRAAIKNLDGESGYEEMLLSDEAFAGSISIMNKQGAFGIKLHEHDKYNGSLKARKSYFFFDNRIVALGSGITSALPERPVHTTLFQKHLSNEGEAVGVNGIMIKDFPWEIELKGKITYVEDGMNNHFFIRGGNVLVKKTLQHSLHEETGAPTQNNFASAVINHGTAPENADYEYMILVQPGRNEAEAVRKLMSSNKKSPYRVIRQDKYAHIVYDKAAQTTGYILFEPVKLKNTDVVGADTPCMIMTTRLSESETAFSICDPDLRFYEGPPDEVYDENGKRTERSVYSRSWINNPSGKSEIEVEIAGEWSLKDETENIRVKNRCRDKTTLVVSCQHGFSREAVLKRLR